MMTIEAVCCELNAPATTCPANRLDEEGVFDALARHALAEYRAGRTVPLRSMGMADDEGV